MAQTTKVALNYDGLAGQGKILKQYGDEVDRLIKKIKNTMTNLNSVWDDAAAQDFTQKVAKLEPTFRQFQESLELLGTHMEKVSQSYKTLSDEVKNSQRF
ncbi:WXG100 family type VII secretion target [Paenibacillus sp. HW567]|uniref:WXG100 family type VII secretion target n=1 Tax=Paenibacillus sp. HW567 TaxID=1034769 RepID=UPI000375EC8A|nr:WXG100 family type VII secretion target [Paenibacillus sp. HW567]